MLMLMIDPADGPRMYSEDWDRTPRRRIEMVLSINPFNDPTVRCILRTTSVNNGGDLLHGRHHGYDWVSKRYAANTKQMHLSCI